MTRHQRKRIASTGGKAVIEKIPPAKCAYCSKGNFKSWHAYLGHMSFHRLADKYFNGDFAAMQKHLRRNGLAKQDPFEGNGAWPKYQPIQQMRLIS